MDAWISGRPVAAHRVWVMSDLQQSDPAAARRCMMVALEDFRSLGIACEQIWYLGDAVEGHRLERVRAMVAMQVELLRPLGIPLRYVNGNHDFDPFQNDPALPVVTPFWEAVQTVPGWRTTERLEDFYFWDRLGEIDVLFLSDHCDGALRADGTRGVPRWISTHGTIRSGREHYPHGPEAYAKLQAEIAAKSGPVIIAGHGPFPGGNRAGDLLAQMLPLPDNVKIHLYGHAHIGDRHWVKEHVYRKIAYVEHQKVPQIDVASLENARGDEIRSVIFEVGAEGNLAVLFRDHSKRRWAELFVVGAER